MSINNIKIKEKFVHLNGFADLYPRNSFIEVKIIENKHTTKTFLATKKKQTITISDNTKIIHELIPKNKNEWIQKATEITKISDKSSPKIRKKDLMHMIETRKDKLINSKTEYYVKKSKTVYTLPDNSKIIHETYPNPKNNNIIFEETIEDIET